MFSKIARIAFVALTIAIAGCSQVLGLVGMGSKSAPVRQQRVERTSSPVVMSTDDPTISRTPLPNSPAPAMSFGPARTAPPTGPDGIPLITTGTPSLTAEVTDLGEGLSELSGFRSTTWGISQQIQGDHIEIAAVTNDPAGNVYVLAERMCSACYPMFDRSYPSPVREGAFKLSALSSDSATFDLVTDQSGSALYVINILTSSLESYRWDRLVAFRKLALLSTPSIDVLGTSGILSEDAENRWGTSSITVPPTLWSTEVQDWLGHIGVPPLGSSMSVGRTTTVGLVREGNIVSVMRHNPADWKQLTVPGPRPLVKWGLPSFLWQEFETSWEAAWERAHTWYSYRWPVTTGGHWIWAGNATSPRVWVLQDK